MYEYFSYNNFKAAARIAEEIESLQRQVAILLQSNSGHPAERSVKATSKTAAPAHSQRKPTKDNGKERGTLRPAVHQVLARSKNPLNAGAICDALVASKYKFSFSAPQEDLAHSTVQDGRHSTPWRWPFQT
jgi:hypothetical protein